MPSRFISLSLRPLAHPSSPFTLMYINADRIVCFHPASSTIVIVGPPSQDEFDEFTVENVYATCAALDMPIPPS